MKIIKCLFGHHEWKIGRKLPVINKNTGETLYLVREWCTVCGKRKRYLANAEGNKTHNEAAEI